MPILALLAGLEWAARQLPSDFSFKKAALESQLEQIETLVFGTSHAQCGINPAELPGQAFNLAGETQTLYFDKFLLERVYPRAPSLERLLLTISYQSLGITSDRLPGIYDRSYYYAFHYGSTKYTEAWKLRRHSLVSLWSVKRTLLRIIDHLENGSTTLNVQRNGWTPNYDHVDIQGSALTTAQAHDHYIDERFYEENTEDLRAMLQLAKNRGLRAYVLSPPMHEAYLEHIDADRYEQMVRIASSVAREFEVPYFNDTYLDIFEEEDFYDSNHLNVEGANRWTRMIARRIEQFESTGSMTELPKTVLPEGR